ncbi:hypothetical protein Tco_0496762 [Tanacetum coccineum]|uniref:Uncharacterized protein n=1 Tax=Tanacetum coccineum TaxID=301880 RepID=A0ABQ5EAS1_9ASTR
MPQLKYYKGSFRSYDTRSQPPRQRRPASGYDPTGIEDMVPSIWSLVKVAYDIYALWGNITLDENNARTSKSLYAYAKREVKYEGRLPHDFRGKMHIISRLHYSAKAYDKELADEVIRIILE